MGSSYSRLIHTLIQQRRQYLAVVNYDFFDDRTQGGSIDFWRIAADPLNPQPMLVQTRYSIPVTRGAHSMVLVP